MNEEIIKTYLELKEKDLSDKYDLPEYKAVEYRDVISKDFPSESPVLKLAFSDDKNLNERLCSLAQVPIENEREVFVKDVESGEIFKITAYARIKKTYSYSVGTLEIYTNPDLGRSIKRKSKKYPKGIKLTKDMLKNSKSYNNFVSEMKKKYKEIRRFHVAEFLYKLRQTKFINKDNLEAVLLEQEYRKLSSKEEKKKFLLEHGFSGVEENFDYEGYSRPDGYGHTTGRSMMLDFKEKKCYIAGWSSDD